jgi:SAM-dependent methyltransferase
VSCRTYAVARKARGVQRARTPAADTITLRANVLFESGEARITLETSIEIYRDYLPPDEAAVIVRSARELVALWACSQTRRLIRARRVEPENGGGGCWRVTGAPVISRRDRCVCAKMTGLNDLYRYAVYYDVIFKRDVGPEIDFLISLFRRHRGRVPSSVLDLGCGPGYHARGFARRGIAACGFDRSPEMLRFAREEAAKEGATVDWRIGDMREFRLAAPVDLAVCLFDSIDGLRTIDDFVAHLRAVAANLVPDGLYVIGQSHQRDTPIIGYGPFHYEAERNGCRVTLDWATDVRTDTLTQTAEVEIVMRVDDNGVESGFRHRTIESFATPLFLVAVARLSGALEAFEWYGDFRLDRPYDDSPASRHCITVFRRAP